MGKCKRTGKKIKRRRREKRKGKGIRVGEKIGSWCRGGWTPLVLTLKSNQGLIKKSQSISREVIGLYRVSVAASFSLSHVVSNCYTLRLAFDSKQFRTHRT